MKNSDKKVLVAKRWRFLRKNVRMKTSMTYLEQTLATTDAVKTQLLKKINFLLTKIIRIFLFK